MNNCTGHRRVGADARVDHDLRKLVIIGSLMAEQFRHLNETTGRRFSDALPDAWELQLQELRDANRNRGNDR